MKKLIFMMSSVLIIDLTILFTLPLMLNGKYPKIGFFSVLGGVVLTGTACCYTSIKIAKAHESRDLFVDHFPQYSFYTWEDFIGTSPERIYPLIPIIKEILSESDFYNLKLNPMEIIKNESK